MRGRKPTPTALRLLQGNAGKRAINDSEPHPAAELADPPAELSIAAREEWARLAPELYSLGLLTTVDRLVFAMYCQASADWLEAELHVSGTCACKSYADDEGNDLGKRGCGMKIVYTDKGNPIQNPWLAIRNKAREQTLKFAAEFGFTPSSRSRVTAAPPDDGSDDLLD